MLLVAALLGVQVTACLFSRRPRLTASLLVISLVLLVEEYYASSLGVEQGAKIAPGPYRIAYQIYTEVSSVHTSSITILALVTAGLLAIGLIGPLIQTAPFVSLISLTGIALISALSVGASINSMIRFNMPYLLIIAGMLLGVCLYTIAEKRLARSLVGILLFKDTIAVLKYLDILKAQAGFVTFYDSIIPTLAVAIIFGLIIGRKVRQHPYLFLIAALTLFVSPRRAPLLALVIAFLILGIIVGTRRVRWSSAITAVALLAGVIGRSYLPTSLSERINQGLGLIFSDAAADASSRGHISDLQVGFEIAKTVPFFGLGPGAGQQRGLVVASSTDFYVHSQFLQTWILAGPFALILLIGLTILAIRLGASVARSQSRTLLDLIAMGIVLASPTCFFFFPYLSRTTRWPLLWGAAIGVLCVANARTSGNVLRWITPKQLAEMETNESDTRPLAETPPGHASRLLDRKRVSATRTNPRTREQIGYRTPSRHSP